MKKKYGLKVLVLLGVFLTLSLAFFQKSYAAEDEPEKYVYREVQRDYDAAQEVLNLVNEERQKRGLSVLQLDYHLTETAMQRAVETSFSFSHTRLTGQGCFSLFPSSAGGYCGENIAAGYADAKSVMNGWMNSEGHRANILNANYNYIGIGCVKYPSGAYGVYWTQVFASNIAYSEETRSGQSREGGYYAYKESHMGDLGGIDFSPVFDAAYYLENNADIKKAYDNDTGKAFAHFLNFGMAEGRCAKADFNVVKYAYCLLNDDLRAAFGGNMREYYNHYMNYGRFEGRSISDWESVFDAEEYIRNNPDVKQYITDKYTEDGNQEGWALWHYCEFGANEGRLANAEFSVLNYAAANADVFRAYSSYNENGITTDFKAIAVQYLQFGRQEGRPIYAKININQLPTEKPEVVEKLGINNLSGWVDWYIREGQ